MTDTLKPPQEAEREAFYAATDEHHRLTGHKPSHFDAWLLAKGLMTTDGRMVAAQPPQAAQPEAEPALSKYKRYGVADEEPSPIERLRAFCSFAMSGQDWLDVEPFFDALAAPAQPEEQGERKSEGAVRHLIRRVTDCIDSDVVVTKTLLQNVVTYLRQHPSLVPMALAEECATECQQAVDYGVWPEHRCSPVCVRFQCGPAAQPEAQELPLLPLSTATAEVFEYCQDDKGEVAGLCWNSAHTRFVVGFLESLNSGDSLPLFTADQMHTYARAAIAQERERQKWISVEDRMPEKNIEVLIAFRDSPLPATGQYTASQHDTWGWCFPKENDPDDTGPITHWMPLPEAPGAALKADSQGGA